MNAQNKNSKPATLVYFKIFKNGKGPNLNKRQLDSFLLSRTRKNFILVPEITGTEQNGDTLFYNIIFQAGTNSQNLVGQPLPVFNLKDIEGREISTNDLKGKPIVINFWFTACVPCIVEMPALNALKEKYEDSGVVFLSMTYEKKHMVMNFLKHHHFTFTSIPDAKAYCDKITHQYPVTLFVDKQGIIKSEAHIMPPLFNYEQTKRIDELDPATFEKNIGAIK